MTDEDQPDLFADDASADADAGEFSTPAPLDLNASADDDASESSLGYEIADLIDEHGPSMEDFVWEAVLEYAEREVRVAAGELIGHLPEWYENRIFNHLLPCAVAVLDRLGLYEPVTILDGRAHDYDALVGAP